MIGTGWQKSSLSFSNSNCTEVRRDGDAIQMRDSKAHGLGPVLSFDRAEWESFIAGVKSGRSLA